MDQASAEKLLVASRRIIQAFEEALLVVNGIADGKEQKNIRVTLARLMASVTVELNCQFCVNFHISIPMMRSLNPSQI
jgi:hypothetical protein